MAYKNMTFEEYYQACRNNCLETDAAAREHPDALDRAMEEIKDAIRHDYEKGLSYKCCEYALSLLMDW